MKNLTELSSAQALKTFAFVLSLVLAGTFWTGSAEAKHPAVRYMERVAVELVKAGRLSSRSAFYKSILRLQVAGIDFQDPVVVIPCIFAGWLHEISVLHVAVG